jgi:hypothetical protein
MTTGFFDTLYRFLAFSATRCIFCVSLRRFSANEAESSKRRTRRLQGKRGITRNLFSSSSPSHALFPASPSLPVPRTMATLSLPEANGTNGLKPSQVAPKKTKLALGNLPPKGEGFGQSQVR